MFNNSNMTDTTSGAESVTLPEHLSAPPLFEELCTAIITIISFLCIFFCWSLFVLFPRFLLAILLSFNPFLASYCPFWYLQTFFWCSTNWRGNIRVVQMCGTQISILHSLQILHHILFWLDKSSLVPLF